MISLKYHDNLKCVFKRLSPLSNNPQESFFLWGPRKSGKSTLLELLYPQAYWVDLLKTDEHIRYLHRPSLLREELLQDKMVKMVVIDEIQKVPLLLDEVHWLIEHTNIIFGLCGSSARKVKRGHANLLGGRALRYELFGLVAHEIGKEFQLSQMLNAGYLPSHYLSSKPMKLLQSYVNDYLKEEIVDEGLVRNFPVFSEFLHIAALSDTEMLQYSNIARECHVSVPTVQQYFQILVDTLLGSFLPSYKKRPKRRVNTLPKFYFADVGVVNFLARRGTIEPGSELFGKAFENWIFHELSAYNHYRERFAELSYWRLVNGTEVDFIVNDFECAIEVKSSANISTHHLRGLRELLKDHKAKIAMVICMEKKARKTEDGILILPATDFISGLWRGDFF